MVNQLKRLMLFIPIDANDLVKKANYNTKAEKIGKKIPDHDKYIITLKFYKLMKEYFAERLKQAKLATKDHVAEFKSKQILIKD